MNAIDHTFDAMDERLAPWKEKWRFDGHLICCRSCDRKQHSHDIRRAFAHAPGCPAATGVTEMPWREFIAILRMEGICQPAGNARSTSPC